MLGSTNNFFKQDKETLLLKRDSVSYMLMIKGYNQLQIEVYLKAYDYFCENPNGFDGATLVRDLCDIDDLDLDAMLHDFHYLAYNVGVNVILKAKADYLYKIGMMRRKEKLQKYWVKFLGMRYIAYSRLVALTIADIGWIPFARIKRGRMSKKQKEAFMYDYNTLML